MATTAMAPIRRMLLAVTVVPALALGVGCAAARPADRPTTRVGSVTLMSAQQPAPCVQPPSYRLDVQPIVQRRCLSCHSGSGDAAEDHDFSRLDVMRAQRHLMRGRVASRAMPPPGAPPLASDEATVLLQWLNCGAP